MTTTTYAQYDLPGILMSEQTTRAVLSRDPQAACDAAPDGAYAFTLFDVVSTVLNGVELRSDPQNRSGRYFIGGDVHSVVSVEEMPGDHTVLLDNMRTNRWTFVIFCPTGNVQPYLPGDTVLGGRTERES